MAGMAGRARRGANRAIAAWGSAAIVVASVVACAPLPTRPLRATAVETSAVAAHPAPPPSTTGFAPANATAADRADTVDRIWRAIDADYYDPTFRGIDVGALRAEARAGAATVASDADFYRLLKRTVRALHDSHTIVLTPREAEEARVRRATQIGIVFAVAESRVVVASVVGGFPAERAGVRAGMVVEAIDAQPLDDAFFARARSDAADGTAAEPQPAEPDAIERSRRLRAVRASLVASDGAPKPHRLSLRRADDSLVEAEVVAQDGDVPTREGLQARPSGVDVLRLSRFDSSIRGRLARDIEAARRTSVGLIIDLRSNPGGEQRLYEWLVGRFVERPVDVAETIERRGTRTVRQPIRVEASTAPYLGPIAILVDRSTASAAELTAHALVEQRDAIVVGEPTCGCVVAIKHDYVLPDGGALRVAQVGFRTAGGRRMEADPLVPRIAVAPTLAERRANVDVVLEAAERALLVRAAASFR